VGERRSAAEAANSEAQTKIMEFKTTAVGVYRGGA
jgi:hypothetical protein